MSPPPYMRLYWGDYHRKTHHLSRSQHGAYLMLLSALWNNGGSLPADDVTLAKHALCTNSEWAAMKALILAFFDVRRGKISSRKLSEELANYKTIIGKRKSAGKTGSEARYGKHRGSSAANAKHVPSQSEPEPEGRLEGSKKPSNATRRDAPEARHDGASDNRVVDLDALRDRIAAEAAALAAEKAVG